MSWRIGAILAALAILALGAIACGDDGDDADGAGSDKEVEESFAKVGAGLDAIIAFGVGGQTSEAEAEYKALHDPVHEIDEVIIEADLELFGRWNEAHNHLEDHILGEGADAGEIVEAAEELQDVLQEAAIELGVSVP